MEEIIRSKIGLYINNWIINLDLSDATKNILKRQLRKTFLDEDFISDLKKQVKEMLEDD